MFKPTLIIILLALRLHTVAQTEQDSMILIDNLQIYYDSDQYELTIEHKELLLNFFDYQNTKELEFYIDAYTDVDGSHEYNQQLSERRTDAIVFWLQNHKVHEDRIIRIGHGEQFARNEEIPTLKAADRRSDIKVYQKAPYKLFKGKVISDQAKDMADLEISIFDNGIKRKVTVDEGHTFSIQVPLDREVELQFEVKDHFPTFKKLKLSSRSNVSQIEMPVVKMDEGAVASLHLQFIGDKSIVLPHFDGSLDILSSVLLKSPNICLELAGHIHQPGDIIEDRTHISFGLSIARSIEVHNHLVEAGIDKDRLLARGYSNSQMKFPEAKNAKETSANRRVEAKVMSCDSTRLIPNDFVKDLAYYNQIDPMEERYHPKRIEDDLAGVDSVFIKQILDEVSHLRKQGKDPKVFPYHVLLKRYAKRVSKF